MYYFLLCVNRPEGLDDEVTNDERSMPGTTTSEPESTIPEEDPEESEEEETELESRGKKPSQKNTLLAPPPVDVQVLTILRMVLKLSSVVE